jgi:hypothetical protein
VSPLDSPDVGNIGALTTSMASMKLSLESINNQRNQQKPTISYHSQSVAATTTASQTDENTLGSNESFRNLQSNSILGHYKNFRSISTIGSISELPEIAMSSSTKSCNQKKNISDEKTEVFKNSSNNNNSNIHNCTNLFLGNRSIEKCLQQQNAIDMEEKQEAENLFGYSSLNTPETPSAKFSQNSLSFTSSKPPSLISPVSNVGNKSWEDDILEFDIKFHELHDTSFRNDVRESYFYKDDPFSILPKKATRTPASTSDACNATNTTFDL